MWQVLRLLCSPGYSCSLLALLCTKGPCSSGRPTAAQLPTVKRPASGPYSTPQNTPPALRAPTSLSLTTCGCFSFVWLSISRTVYLFICSGRPRACTDRQDSGSALRQPLQPDPTHHPQTACGALGCLLLRAPAEHEPALWPGKQPHSVAHLAPALQKLAGHSLPRLQVQHFGYEPKRALPHSADLQSSGKQYWGCTSNWVCLVGGGGMAER